MVISLNLWWGAGAYRSTSTVTWRRTTQRSAPTPGADTWQQPSTPGSRQAHLAAAKHTAETMQSRGEAPTVAHSATVECKRILVQGRQAACKEESGAHRRRDDLRRCDGSEKPDPGREGSHNGEDDEEEGEVGRCRGREADHEVHDQREDHRLDDGEGDRLPPQAEGVAGCMTTGRGSRAPRRTRRWCAVHGSRGAGGDSERRGW